MTIIGGSTCSISRVDTTAKEPQNVEKPRTSHSIITPSGSRLFISDKVFNTLGFGEGDIRITKI